jgi:branched-chain amino acid transport system permease protein
MSSVLVSGLIAGTLYALVGAGLVVVYRQSHVLNFAHGAIGSAAAYIAHSLIQHGWPYGAAAVLAIAAAALLSALIEMLVIRRLRQVAEFTVSVATLGIGLLIIGVLTWRWGGEPLTLRSPITAKWTLDVLGLSVGATQLLSVAAALVVFVALHVVVAHTRFGLAMRAVSEGPLTAAIVGVDVGLVRATVWALAGALAAIAALLVSSIYHLDPQYMTAFMITAFAAVVLGGLESIGGVLVGGLLFGLGNSLLGYYVTAELSHTAAFVAIVGMLLVLPHGLFGRRLHRVAEPVIRRSLPAGLTLTNRRLGPRLAASLDQGRIAVVGTGCAVLLVLPWLLPDVTTFNVSLVLATFLAVLGQNVISGYGGQASIGQSGFMVVGGYVAALLATRAALPFPVVLVASVLASAAAGAVLAFSAARLSGVYLALVTLAFALALPELAQFPDGLTGGADGTFVDAQSFFGIELAGTRTQYLFVYVVAAVVAGAFLLASRGAPGRRWRAVRDSEAGARSIGIRVERVKIAAVAVGAGLSGLGASLSVVLVGFVSPDSFTLWTAIYLLAAVVIGGSSSVLGSLIGAAFITLVPIYTSSVPEVPQIAFGAAIVAAVLFAPRGLVNVVRLPRRAVASPRTARERARASGCQGLRAPRPSLSTTPSVSTTCGPATARCPCSRACRCVSRSARS